MINKLLLIFTIYLFSDLAYSQLPEKVSPEVYKVILENKDVKVYEVEFNPGQSDKMHKHKVTTFYVVEGGTFKSTAKDGTITEREFKAGDNGHTDQGAVHQVTNTGNTTIKILLVEHKKLRIKKKK